MRIVALAGGVGGAKFADGLAQVLPADDLTIIVNTADDFEHWGLRISPDLDTVCYTLAGIANSATGWGRAHETWRVLAAVKSLGGETWFQLGDRDLATHIERTRKLAQGVRLSKVTKQFCASWGVRPTVLPMTDERVSTILDTDEGRLPFQDYFVKRRCLPKVTGIAFEGIQSAQPAPGVVDALKAAECVVICPSNPWVSIGPILAVPGLRGLISRKTTVAITPIVRGRALRGPAAKIYAEMGLHPSAVAVAEQYREVIGAFVLDRQDTELRTTIENLGLITVLANTIMRNRRDRKRLALTLISFIEGRR